MLFVHRGGPQTLPRVCSALDSCNPPAPAESRGADGAGIDCHEEAVDVWLPSGVDGRRPPSKTSAPLGVGHVGHIPSGLVVSIRWPPGGIPAIDQRYTKTGKIELPVLVMGGAQYQHVVVGADRRRLTAPHVVV